MPQYKKIIQAVPLFVAFASCVLLSFIPSLFALSNFNCDEETVKLCQTCPNGTFANETILECNCCFLYNVSGQCIGYKKCDNCQPGSYQNKQGQTSCKPCGIGTNCSTSGCTVCLTCPKGHEAKSKGSANCTECEKGHFKPYGNSELCWECNAGSYTNMTGQTFCINCPGGYYCPAGADGPKRCGVSQACPPGSGSPGVCEAPWHSVDGNQCVLSAALIIVIAVIIIPIALAVIIVIIYKLWKCWKEYRHQELFGDEREPLLTGSRPSSRIQEPVYTGL